MTKQMENIINRLRNMPEALQDQVAADVADILEDFATPEEVAAIVRGRAEIERGEFTTLEDLKHEMESDSR